MGAREVKKALSTLWMSGMKTEEKVTYDLAVEGLRVKQSNTDLLFQIGGNLSGFVARQG